MKLSTLDKPMNLFEAIGNLALIPRILQTLINLKKRLMSALEAFEALKPKVLELLDRLKQTTDQSQQLADLQKQLAEALANDKADKDAIDAANAKAAELQAAADAKAQEDAQLVSEISQLSQQLDGTAEPATEAPA